MRTLTLAVLISAVFALGAAAQEDMAFEEWMDYGSAYGEVRVVGTSERTLTILDVGAALDEDAIVKYYIRDDVELETVEDYREIMVGDMVDLEYYTTADGKRVVDFISVERDEKEEVKDILLQTE
ncbi:MAG: hypothetical protein ABH875_01170 [Candidatus Omnitrophota bacterium]